MPIEAPKLTQDAERGGSVGTSGGTVDRTAPAGCWGPWAALANAPTIATRIGLKPSLFLSRISIGDAREIFQGDGHRNQLVAVAINADVAHRIVRAVECHDDLIAALVAARGVIDPKKAPLTHQRVCDAIDKARAALSKAEPTR